MTVRRVTIARLMLLTALLGLDFAWLRYVNDARRWRSSFGFHWANDGLANARIFDFGLFGMFNVLAFPLARLPARGRDERRRLMTFVACGFLSSFLYWATCCLCGAWLLPEPRGRHRWGVHSIGEWTNEGLRAVGVDPWAVIRRFGSNVFVTLANIAALTLPPLALAVVSARLVHRLRTEKK